MKILFVSTLSSLQLIKDIYNRTKSNPGFAVQKFNRLLAIGLIKNGAQVSTMSAPPILSGYTNKLYIRFQNEIEDGISYSYTPYFRSTIIKRLIAFIYTFFKVLAFGSSSSREKAIICDVLNISVCMAAVLASKLNKTKIIGVVTDLPGLMVSEDRNHSILGKLNTWINNSYLSSFCAYIFLTKAMDQVVNKYHRPYIVMEGLVDSKSMNLPIVNADKRNKSIIYAGGLFEEYGLKILIEAFEDIQASGYTLDIYGSGALVDWIKCESLRYPGIIYHGVVSNDEVVEAERNALLLINPRPTHEEFTKFSFPSKNMEYMLSGTPLLTTCLPGMPAEYYPHIFLFDEETKDGFKDTIKRIILTDDAKLVAKGEAAKNWVLKNKNNIIQAKKVLELITKI